MFKKFLLIVLSFCFLLGMATRKELENVKKVAESESTATAESTTVEAVKGYRIAVDSVKKEEGKWMIRQPKEIRFVSPAGKTIRTIPYETGEQQLKFRISPASNYVANLEVKDLKEVEIKVIQKQMKLRAVDLSKLDFTYIDRTGKEKWVKEFIVEGVGSETFPSYGIEFSKDGGSIVIYKNHELGYDSSRCDITVLDTLGREIISYSFDNMIETGALQISPDGKIIGAPTYKKGLGECLFFLDVKSGKTKIVKAKGDLNGKKWSAYFILSEFTDPNLPPRGKVWLSVAVNPKNKWFGYLTFDEIPSDLSTLFGGEK
jgi:hypothetical protein